MSKFDQGEQRQVRVVSPDELQHDRQSSTQSDVPVISGSAAPRLDRLLAGDAARAAKPRLSVFENASNVEAQESNSTGRTSAVNASSLQQESLPKTSNREPVMLRRRLSEEQWLDLAALGLSEGATLDQSGRLSLNQKAMQLIQEEHTKLSFRADPENVKFPFYINLPVKGPEVDRLIRISQSLQEKSPLRVYDGPSDFEDHLEVARWIRRHDATLDGDFVVLPMELIRVLKQGRTGEDAGMPLLREEQRNGREFVREIRLYQLSPEDILHWSRLKEEDRPTFKYRYNPEDRDVLEEAMQTPKSTWDVVVGKSRALWSNHYVRVTATISTFAGGVYALLPSDVSDKVQEYLKFDKPQPTVVQPVDENTTFSIRAAGPEPLEPGGSHHEQGKYSAS